MTIFCVYFAANYYLLPCSIANWNTKKGKQGEMIIDSRPCAAVSFTNTGRLRSLPRQP